MQLSDLWILKWSWECRLGRFYRGMWENLHTYKDRLWYLLMVRTQVHSGPFVIILKLPSLLGCYHSSLFSSLKHPRASQITLVVKNLPANAGEAEDTSLIPGSGRSPGVGNGNPLQCSCLEDLMDRGVWWAIVHGVAKSHTWLNIWAHTNIDISKYSLSEKPTA